MYSPLLNVCIRAVTGDSKEERYVFTKRGAKHKNGDRNHTRATKATNSGYWEETGSEEHMSPPPNQNLGMPIKGVKKTLVFNIGKSPNYTSPTDWFMHEYSLVYKVSFIFQTQFIYNIIAKFVKNYLIKS